MVCDFCDGCEGVLEDFLNIPYCLLLIPFFDYESLILAKQEPSSCMLLRLGILFLFKYLYELSIHRYY